MISERSISPIHRVSSAWLPLALAQFIWVCVINSRFMYTSDVEDVLRMGLVPPRSLSDIQ